MVKNLKSQEISKTETLELLKKWLKEKKDLHYRSTISEESLDKGSWDKFIAFQLGYLKAIEEFNNFIPDPVTINE